MYSLHSGGDTQLGKAWDICRIDVLCMLNAPAQFLTIDAGLFEHALVDVERLAIGALADGMSVDLEAVLDGELGRALYLCYRFQHQAGGI